MSMPLVRPTRRRLLTGAAACAAAPLLHAQTRARPNILWLTCEDMGPHLGACGDSYSVTPNLDRLAARGCVFQNAWSNAPVCAPARTTIVSGVYCSSTGSEHHRSIVSMPPGWKMFPGYLREDGYYCTNNVKEDYNLVKPEDTWDESRRTAHWRNRKPGQPFFAVFNNEVTHESQLWKSATNTAFRHDPAEVRLPAYHPDTPEARRDWAQYYDNITLMDQQFQPRLEELEKDGLADDTIVFFFGDHGSGMSRSKRFCYDSGLRVSVVAYFPQKFRHLAPNEYSPGTRSDRLIGFVDLAPTMLSLAGIQPPAFYQGQAFSGAYETPARTYSFGYRGRMDEKQELIRAVRDRQYVYIRNYNPHKIYGQYLEYGWRTPSTPVWERLYKEGKLKPPQTYFWERKPPEELYDLSTDRDEVRNLAGRFEMRSTLERFRRAHAEHEQRIRDVDLLPEADMHARLRGSTPYEMGHDPARYPFNRVFEAAEVASSLRPGATNSIVQAMKDADSGVRYWGVMGALMRGADEVDRCIEELREALQDRSPVVRIAAAEALGKYSSGDDVSASLAVLIRLADPAANGAYVSIAALNAIDALGGRADGLREKLKALPLQDPKSPTRVNGEPAKLVSRLLSK